tara:strand:+ start:112 stop:468 length:357 start_codon:yes stop_codon:yes gene_type:complete
MKSKINNLQDLETSINALHKKASDINDLIKKNSISLKSDRKAKKHVESSPAKLNLTSINKSSKEEDYIEITEIKKLENKLKEELFELKNKQRTLSVILFITILVFLSLIILTIELNFI